MTLQQAEIKLKEKYPQKKIIAGGDYDEDHYVIEAVDTDKDPSDQVDPYFGVDKKTGEISNFMPDDLEKFINCLYSK